MEPENSQNQQQTNQTSTGGEPLPPSTQVPQPRPESTPLDVVSPEVSPKRSKKAVTIVALLLILIAGITIFVLYLKKSTQQEMASKPQVSTKGTPSPEQPIGHYIGSQTVDLVDVSGGTNSGFVTRKITKGLVTHTLQAQLPDPEEGYIYQSWMIRDNEDPIRYAILIKDEQGLYTLDTEFKFDLTEPPFTTFETMHNTFIVSKESINDDLIETKILEGTFTQ